MDIETYASRERELLFAAELLEAERERLAGDQGYTLDELAALEKAIETAEQDGAEHGA